MTAETTTTPTGVGRVIAAMRYRDARRAVTWLREAFGFEPVAVFPETGETVDHAEMAYGNGYIMFGSERESPFPLSTAVDAPQTVSIYVIVDPGEIDAHFARARAAGADIVMDLYNTDYGAREYSARDFEGHLWSFGTYVPQRPAE